MIPQNVVDYLTGQSPFSVELQCFFMAVQGCMKVRLAHRTKPLSWFHAFCLSVVSGYGGGLLTPIWMGLPTPMLSNDLCVASCIVAFVLVNYTPGDIGFKIFSTFPALVITTVFAQLFRITGIVKFVDIAFNAFKEKPSDYYPIPIVGPIAYATILGNMGSFFLQGFHGYLRDGMPWPVQNGLFCASFYHFYSHDKVGPVGVNLRRAVNRALPDVVGVLGLADDRTFAFVVVSIFMHTMCILQLPQFLGPTFSPFTSFVPKQQQQTTLRSPNKEMVAQSNAAVKKKKKAKSS